MKKTIVIILTLMLTSTVALAVEPYGGKKHYMSFAIGGYSPSKDLDDEGYKSGGDFCFNYMTVLKNYFGFGGNCFGCLLNQLCILYISRQPSG